MIGIRNTSFLSANQVRTNTLVFASLADLVIPIGRNGIIAARYHLVTTAAFNNFGIRFQLLVPAGGLSYQVDYNAPVFDALSGSTADNDGWINAFGISLQAVGTFSVWAATSAATFAPIDINCLIQNGPTAGNLDLQFTQTVNGATPTVVLKGSYVDWTILK